MNEKELRKLPLNDEFAQCMRKLRDYSNEITETRKEEIHRCNHLFILLRKGEEIYGCHSTDYYRDADEVECVHCGLTNRFERIESILDNDYNEYFKTFSGMISSSTRYNRKTLESQLFREIFKNLYYRGGKSFNNSNLNLISKECLLTYHPGLLYRLALQINPSANDKEIFEIMKQLHILETNQEKIRLQTEEQATGLLDRYCIPKPKCLTLKR